MHSPRARERLTCDALKSTLASRRKALFLPEQRAGLLHEALVLGRVPLDDFTRRGRLARRRERRRERVDVRFGRRALGERGGVLRRAQRGGSGSVGRTTAASNTSATICLQSPEREPPPTQTSSEGGDKPSSIKRDAPPRNANVARLHRRAVCHARVRQRPRPEAEQRARGLRPVGHALADQVRQEAHAVASGRTSRARAASAACDAASSFLAHARPPRRRACS